jgi:hypothetical protein
MRFLLDRHTFGCNCTAQRHAGASTPLLGKFVELRRTGRPGAAVPTWAVAWPTIGLDFISF